MGEAKAASVRSGGDAWHVAKVVKTDVVNDWCLLHAPTMTVAPMPSAPNDRPASGSAVYCAGYPVETASKKAMAAPELRRATLVAVTGLEGDRRHMQVMVSGIQGMSGAAVVDEYGEWVGIVSERLDGLIQSVAPRGAVAAGVRFALKAEAVRSSLPSEVVPASASAPEKRPTAEELGKQIQPAIVMIQLKGN
jgi:S1-C subfamily serine protease